MGLSKLNRISLAWHYQLIIYQFKTKTTKTHKKNNNNNVQNKLIVTEKFEHSFALSQHHAKIVVDNENCQ